MSNNPRSGQHMPRQHDDIGPKPMTRARALAEAQRRWGYAAFVKRSKRHGYMVGFYVQKPVIRKWYIRGTGDSWEAAFKDASGRDQ